MKIFLTGASGFIGGSVAARFLKEGYQIRGLVRDANKAKQLQALGIEPILGTLTDSTILIENAKWADAVVNAASSDNLGAVEVLIEGLAGSNKVLLHTSGSSLVGDDARGEFASEKIFNETTPIEPTPLKAARVALDQLVKDAAKRHVKSVILCNTLIYGEGLGINKDSIQLPRLIKQALKSGIARHVGKGLNIWSNVHISDVAELYLIALTHAPAGSFYFVENGSASFRDMTTALAKRFKVSGPEDWPHAEAVKEWGYEHATYGLGCNSRVSADKARKELGWKPAHRSVVQYIEQELELS